MANAAIFKKKFIVFAKHVQKTAVEGEFSCLFWKSVELNTTLEFFWGKRIIPSNLTLSLPMHDVCSITKFQCHTKADQTQMKNAFCTLFFLASGCVCFSVWLGFLFVLVGFFLFWGSGFFVIIWFLGLFPTPSWVCFGDLVFGVF